MALDPVTAIADLGRSVLDRFIPDKTEAQKAKDALAAASQAGQLQDLQDQFLLVQGQLDINKVEAGSNFFVAGWRPFVGWACGLAFAYDVLVERMMKFGLVAFHSAVDLHQLPELDASAYMPLLTSMLGLGAMRTFEKLKGVAGPGAH